MTAMKKGSVNWIGLAGLLHEPHHILSMGFPTRSKTNQAVCKLGCTEDS